MPLASKPRVLSRFPRPFIEESLYSLVARYHREAGNIALPDTLQELFGTPRLRIAGVHSRLGHFHSILPPGVSPSTLEIVRKHTIYPALRLIYPRRQYERCIDLLQSADAVGNQLKLAMVRNRKPHHLLFCPTCTELD